jgi:hypothetical protein
MDENRLRFNLPITRRSFLRATGAASAAGIVGLSLSRITPAAAGDVIAYDRGWRFDRNGWIYLHIEGDAATRGFQHGHLLAKELAEIKRSLVYLTYRNTGKTWDFFVEAGKALFTPRIEREYLDEMRGISEGARAAGVELTLDEVITLNGYDELVGYWWPTVAEKYRYVSRVYPDKDHCSAFIATGSMTTDRSIVIAHNSWDEFTSGQFVNVVMDLVPATGNRILMQSAPGWIDSFTDFFVTEAGIVGTETTIGGFSLYEENEVPEFVRIRRAMQYGKTLDDYVDFMAKKNSGGYANSWLLGDINTGEIMRYELGLHIKSVQRTTDGSYVGFNAPVDPALRNLECADTGYDDIRKPAGARRVRLTQLMEENRGKIDVERAKKILADHYDVYLKKDNPSLRTVDGHYELDPMYYTEFRLPYQPRGAVDGKVTDSALAAKLSFCGRWGNSSGMAFDADAFLEEHPQWDYLAGYLKDRPSQPWTLFAAGQKP